MNFLSNIFFMSKQNMKLKSDLKLNNSHSWQVDIRCEDRINTDMTLPRMSMSTAGRTTEQI